jgi:ribosomal protein S1
MESTVDSNNQEEGVSEEISILQDLAQLLDEHDYDLPSVGDIRNGIIVSVSNQGIIVDLGLKRDGLVQPTDLFDLDF